MLIAFRIVQAAGAALLTPTSLGLILATFPPQGRQGAVRTWTAVGGLAATLGPVVGGLLVAASWRWVFLVNVPIGLLALVVGWRRLPRVPGHPVPAPDARRGAADHRPASPRSFSGWSTAARGAGGTAGRSPRWRRGGVLLGAVRRPLRRATATR